jgi:DNA-binding Lrp family transcriptional regulator
MNSLLSDLITSKTRIRILMRLFLNPQQDAHLRGLATEFSLSPSQVREELKQLNRSELLLSSKKGRQINYQANTRHPLFPELHSMVKKALGMDRIVESIIERLGDLEQALLIDDYAAGKDSGLIDLVLVGAIDRENLNDLVAKTERHIGRKIRTLVLSSEEFEDFESTLMNRPQLLLWSRPEER